MKPMGHFTAIGMRVSVKDPNALVINTCSGNDTAEIGDLTHWTWVNPTNRAITHPYEDIEAVSVECLWQAMKICKDQVSPRPEILAGDWRKGKGKRPMGAWAGPWQPLITNVGEARRKIYIPAYRRLLLYWMKNREVQSLLYKAAKHDGPVFLRDHDSGRGIDRNGPMSHAWVLAVWLNTQDFIIRSLELAEASER